jgi:glycine cleavage system aminomethyltransferase T
MSERLPLHDIHERLGARFTETGGRLLPGHYGDPGAEHDAVRERAGLIDRSERGKIEVTGKERASFIHGLVSNDVKGLVPGQGREAALLDVHGKITALLVAHCWPDRLVLETEGPLATVLASTIDHYLFSERAELEDVTPAWSILTVAGPASRKIVEEAVGTPAPDLGRWQHVVVPRDGAETRVVRGEETGEPAVGSAPERGGQAGRA